jgi:hypothetical protein
MEHAVPEEFWVDKSKCKYTDADGKVQNPTLQACAEGISAVKAIAIAQSQGQKIYTINKENRDTALPKLTIGGAVGDEIRNAINAGKEVTFHESAISAHGWSGDGYIILDPETGVGAHLIDGGGNGAILFIIGVFIIGMILAMIPAIIATGGAVIVALAPLLLLGIGAFLMGASMLGIIDNSLCEVGLSIIVGISLLAVATILTPAVSAVVGLASAGIFAGLLHLALDPVVVSGYGAAYTWLIGDGICQR